MSADACATPGCGHAKHEHHAKGCSNWTQYELADVCCRCTAYLPPRPVPEEVCKCGHGRDEHNFDYIRKGVCHVAPCLCARWDTAREERDDAEAMIDRFRLVAIQASDNRDSVAAELDALRDEVRSLADKWEGHSRPYPTIGRQAAALELRALLAPATVPAPHTEAEAAWEAWLDPLSHSVASPGLIDCTHKAFIAGYLRGRDDRG